jgi:ArsR family transcriptional regulator, arsenate/arsenite/antimonite-responsive transcriptional repressor
MKEYLQLFKALSDETRLRLILLLAHGEMCVCDLTEALRLPQSTVSRHLGHLKKAGLVVDSRRGVWSFYRLVGPGETGFTELPGILVNLLSADKDVLRDLAALQLFRGGPARKCE